MFREVSKFSQFDKVYTLRGQCPTSKEESKLSIMLMLIALKMNFLESCLIRKSIMVFKTLAMMMTLAVVVMIVTDCLATHPKVEEQVRGR